MDGSRGVGVVAPGISTAGNSAAPQSAANLSPPFKLPPDFLVTHWQSLKADATRPIGPAKSCKHEELSN